MPNRTQNLIRETRKLVLATMIFANEDRAASQDFSRQVQGNMCSIPKRHTKAEEKIVWGQNVSRTANYATEKNAKEKIFLST